MSLTSFHSLQGPHMTTSKALIFLALLLTGTLAARPTPKGRQLQRKNGPLPPCRTSCSSSSEAVVASHSGPVTIRSEKNEKSETDSKGGPSPTAAQSTSKATSDVAAGVQGTSSAAAAPGPAAAASAAAAPGTAAAETTQSSPAAAKGGSEGAAVAVNQAKAASSSSSSSSSSTGGPSLLQPEAAAPSNLPAASAQPK